MHLDDTRKDYIRYRLDTARENLEAATLLLENDKLKSAANRAYFIDCIK